MSYDETQALHYKTDIEFFGKNNHLGTSRLAGMFSAKELYTSKHGQLLFSAITRDKAKEKSY